MSEQSTRLAEAATQIIKNGFPLPSPGTGKRVTIYNSPIDAVAPLTVSAARRLLFAKALTALITELGYEVQCHSLFADYEQPVKKLTVSIWLRYLELCGESITYPEDCYQGDYIFDFAATVHRTYSNLWHVTAKDVAELQSQVHYCVDMYNPILEWLGDEALATIQHIGLHSINQDISSDLKEIDVDFTKWPWASTLLHDGTVSEVINRLKANDLVHIDGLSSCIKSPPTDEATNKPLLENRDGPTSFAIQLSHYLSVFGKEDGSSDLNICIYDINEAEHIKLFNNCLKSLGYLVAPMIEKPISSPLLLELGELVQTSPLAEDFVSFREARHIMGLSNLQWLFAEHQSSESMKIDLSSEMNGLCIQKCSGIARNSWIQSWSYDTEHWARVLSAPDASRQLAESFLLTITDFHDVVNKTVQRLEPALLINYYRNLCESFLVYYNNHELNASAHGSTTPENQYSAQSHDKIGTAMALALQRLLALIDSIIGSTNSR